MKKAKAFLAVIVLLIYAVSMVNAALPVMRPSQAFVAKPNPQLIAPSININLIKIAPASAGDGEQ